MSKFYTDLIEVDSHFSEAAEQFERLIDGLKGTETLSQEHGEVEKWLSSEGNELLRRLFQAHFDIRTEQETVQVGIECNDEVVRTRRRLGVRRKLSTLFGKIEHHRIGYSSPGTHTLYPLDMSLNLGMTKYTDGLHYRVAHEAARNSFDECVERLHRLRVGIPLNANAKRWSHRRLKILKPITKPLWEMNVGNQTY